MTAVATRARESGHLLSIPNQTEVIDDQGMAFVLRYAPQLIDKIRSAKSPVRDNPFLPPEAELTVGPIGPHHQLVLNKFNVLEPHGLIITNQFVPQTDQLTLRDFSAVAQVLADVDGLVFYNGGEAAGASQAHRHFQLVPMDMGNGGMPLQHWIDQVPHPERRGLFPFQYRFLSLPDTDAGTLFDAWQKLEFAWQPYNLLLTRRWMLVIPRSGESFGSVSVNSLGFAGALLAKNHDELKLIRQTGPMALLSAVTFSGE